jgi:hypothetical protein
MTPCLTSCGPPATPTPITCACPTCPASCASSRRCWTGELKLSFFRDGLRLTFAKGKLTASEPWSPAHNGESACFRGGTFLHLLFGMHSMEELRHLNPDCSASSREAKALLPILFPKQHSSVWAVA